MRYSLEPNYGKYVQGYDFLLLEKKVAYKYSKNLMDTGKKTGLDAAKAASKRLVQKTAKATGDLIRNKLADKITLLGKSQNK